MSGSPGALGGFCARVALLVFATACAAVDGARPGAALAGERPPSGAAAAPGTTPQPMAMPPRPVLDDAGISYVSGDETLHPHVRYRDGQVSQNDSCAIRIGNKLSRKIPPVYVNGQPIGFC